MTAGRRLADAIAAKDADALRQLLAPGLDFRGLTPGRTWEATTADGFLDAALGHWFTDDDRIGGVEISEGEPVEDTGHVSYRLALTTSAGPHTCEQQVYYRTDGDRISWLRVLCSGFRPAE